MLDCRTTQGISLEKSLIAVTAAIFRYNSDTFEERSFNQIETESLFHNFYGIPPLVPATHISKQCDDAFNTLSVHCRRELASLGLTLTRDKRAVELTQPDDDCDEDYSAVRIPLAADWSEARLEVTDFTILTVRLGVLTQRHSCHRKGLLHARRLQLT
jgi:hypothetical protein